MSFPKPRDAMRGFLAIALLTCFMVALFWLLQENVPEQNRDLVTYMLGQLSGLAAAAMVYYFGTSKSSSDKNDNIERTGIKPRGTADDPVHVDEAGDPVPVRHRPLPEPTFGRPKPDTPEGE